MVQTLGAGQEYIAPYTPEQNGLCERFIRTIKEECCWQHRFEGIDHARRVIAAWITWYNSARPHSALEYKSPDSFHRRVTMNAPASATSAAA